MTSKLMTSQTGKQIITTHVLHNISRSKGNQTMNFGKLIEYNLRNTFSEKSCTECLGEASPRSFFKKSKISISLDEQSEYLYNLFLLYLQVEDY